MSLPASPGLTGIDFVAAPRQILQHEIGGTRGLPDAPTMAMVFDLFEDGADIGVVVAVVVHLRPQWGGRFSRKAAMPSALSP